MAERFMPGLPRSVGLWAAHWPPPGVLVMQPSTRIFSSTRPTVRSQAAGAICLSRAKIPARSIRCGGRGSWRAEQVLSAIWSYEQANRNSWNGFSKTIR